VNFWTAYEREQKIIAESAAKTPYTDNTSKPPALGVAPPDNVNADTTLPETNKEDE